MNAIQEYKPKGLKENSTALNKSQSNTRFSSRKLEKSVKSHSNLRQQKENSKPLIKQDNKLDIPSPAAAWVETLEISGLDQSTDDLSLKRMCKGYHIIKSELEKDNLTGESTGRALLQLRCLPHTQSSDSLKYNLVSKGLSIKKVSKDNRKQKQCYQGKLTIAQSAPRKFTPVLGNNSRESKMKALESSQNVYGSTPGVGMWQRVVNKPIRDKELERTLQQWKSRDTTNKTGFYCKKNFKVQQKMSNLLMDDSSETESAKSFGSASEIPDEVLGEPIYIERDSKFYKVLKEKGNTIEKPGKIDKVCIAWKQGICELDDEEFQEYQMGQGQLPEILERVITTMSKGEYCQVYKQSGLPSPEYYTFTVKLQSWVSVHDLKLDGNLIKSIIQRGIGYERLSFKDDLEINLKIVVDDSVKMNEQQWKKVMDPDEVSEGLFQILQSMKLKEIASIKVNIDYFNANFDKILPEVQAENDVTVEIEVVDFKKVEDVYLDGSFYKRILIDGEGKSLPNSNARVRVFYQLQVEGQVVIENFQGEPYQLIMDEDEVPSLWTHCLRQMKEGDRVQVDCNLLGLHGHYLSDGLNEEFNFHTYAGENQINATLVLELVSFTMGKTNYNFTYQERADEALRIKEAGTKLFRRQLLERALEKYEAANSTIAPVSDNPHLFRPIQIQLLSNISLCHMKLGKWHEGINFSNQVLDLNSNDVKALFRKAMCRKELGMYNEALIDLKTAIRIDPNSKEVQVEIGRLQKLIKEHNQAEKSIYGRMFK